MAHQSKKQKVEDTRPQAITLEKITFETHAASSKEFAGFGLTGLEEVTLTFKHCRFGPGVLHQLLAFFVSAAKEITSLTLEACDFEEKDLRVLQSMAALRELCFEGVPCLTGKFMQHTTSNSVTSFSAKNCCRFNPCMLLEFLGKNGSLLRFLDLGLDEDYIDEVTPKAMQQRRSDMDEFLQKFTPSRLTSLILHDRDLTPSRLLAFLAKCPRVMFELNLNDVNALDAKIAALICEKEISYLSVMSQATFMEDLYHKLSSEGLYLNLQGHSYLDNAVISSMVSSGCLASTHTLILNQTGVTLNEEFGKLVQQVKNLAVLSIGQLDNHHDGDTFDVALRALLPFLKKGITVKIFDVNKASKETRQAYASSRVTME